MQLLRLSRDESGNEENPPRNVGMLPKVGTFVAIAVMGTVFFGTEIVGFLCFWTIPPRLSPFAVKDGQQVRY
jgi:hypothetical protein